MSAHKVSVNVPKYVFGKGAIDSLADVVAQRRNHGGGFIVYLVDEYFRDHKLRDRLPAAAGDVFEIIGTDEEPTTDGIDALTARVHALGRGIPAAVIGIGGGITLDTAKAVSNLLTNGGKSEDYQGWDLVKVPGVFKVGVPTLSGTGAEASRTCVLTNKKKNIKLGMNSPHSIFDFLVLDPDLTKTVDRSQYFYSGMDTYIHCVESLAGSYRHAMADSFSHQAIALCREIFLGDDMMSDEMREKMMVASYLGGASIANTFVGVVHPLSAGLSTVLHTHHCLANCIVMEAMHDFYADAVKEFQKFKQRQGVTIPKGICGKLSADEFKMLYDSSVVHEKPLTNALGAGYRDVLTRDRVERLYRAM